MKIILWGFAIVGLIGVLMIGGCFALFGTAAYMASGNTPDYVTKENVKKEHGSSLEVAKEKLAALKTDEKLVLDAKEVPGVLAIQRELKKDGPGMTKYESLFPNESVKLSNYSTVNGIGYGEMSENGNKTPVVILSYSVNGQDFRFLLADWGPGIQKE